MPLTPAGRQILGVGGQLGLHSKLQARGSSETKKKTGVRATAHLGRSEDGFEELPLSSSGGSGDGVHIFRLDGRHLPTTPVLWPFALALRRSSTSQTQAAD